MSTSCLAGAFLFETLICEFLVKTGSDDGVHLLPGRALFFYYAGCTPNHFFHLLSVATIKTYISKLEMGFGWSQWVDMVSGINVDGVKAQID